MATGIEERLQVLGIALPDPPPGGNYDSPKIIDGVSNLLVEIFWRRWPACTRSRRRLRASEERIGGSSHGS